MGVGRLQGKCFAAQTRMRHELKYGDKPPPPAPYPLPPPTFFRPSPVQPPSSPFPVHSYFRLECALACCPWQAWLRVRPTTNQNLSPGRHQWLNAHPTPRFCFSPYFNSCLIRVLAAKHLPIHITPVLLHP